MNDVNTMDITPTPRILRTLGEIPFDTWQCIAELVDNSIDAFLSHQEEEDEQAERKITISWSSENVPMPARTIEIRDNASGMSIEQLRNSVKAGYSSNSPIGNLGLFGMGFNISTARLGEVTEVVTTRRGDAEWVGVRIDFQKLIDAKEFQAPVIRKPKDNPQEQGTKITIGRIKQGILSQLDNKERDIRNRLSVIYTPLLEQNDIDIHVHGIKLRPHKCCVWSESRFVVYKKKERIPAKIIIDRDFGKALFDLNRNCYLTPAEQDDLNEAEMRGEARPSYIVERSKRLTGWVGIQRYADPNDYGIDFIRNGRKILISDKTLFYFENPYTGQKEIQYPVDLGTSIGGRIIGELNVDYLVPTYQKNDFDRSDHSWQQTVEALCGVGPFLPQRRKALGYNEPNDAPLYKLVTAYRRVDKGTKCLFAPNDLAKRYAAEFYKDKPDYIEDTKWWKAAQEEDEKNNPGSSNDTPVNPGETPSDDLSDYLGGNDDESSENDDARGDNEQPHGGADTNTTNPPVNHEPETSTLDDLIQNSVPATQLSGANYRFGNVPPLNIRAYKLQNGEIKYNGESRPCFFHSDGIDCDFVFNPRHILLAQYPIMPQMLLLTYLSEKLKARDGLPDIVAVYATLAEECMKDSRIDKQTLLDRAYSALEALREKMTDALRNRATDVIACIYESSGEVEETVNKIINSNDQNLFDAFQRRMPEGYAALSYVPYKTLYRLLEKFPEEVFDGKVFSAPYMRIHLADDNATNRTREASKEKTLSYVNDVLGMVSGYSPNPKKEELTRVSLSVDFMMRELSE